MGVKKILILLIFVFFKYNLASNCLPCTCESSEKSVIGLCSHKTTGNVKLKQIPPEIIKYNYEIGISELNFKGQIFNELNNDLSNLYSVEILIFSHNLISNIQPNSLENLTALRTLNLDHNQIVVIPTELFKNNAKIKHIFLNNNKIKQLTQKVFENLPNLTEVHLNQNNIERIEDKCFVNVPSLTTLDFKNNNLTSLRLNFIDSYDNLTLVYFHDNPWVCNITLCDLINVSLEKNWLKDIIPECYHANTNDVSKTGRYWGDLHILEPIKILEFQSPVYVNQNVLLSCQIYTCSLSTRLSWNHDDLFMENSTYCINGYKHTITNVLTAVTKDNEGLYTCFIDNCSFCGNSSRYLTVINDDSIGETATDVLNISTGIQPINITANAVIPKIELPCFICLIIGICIGIFFGIIVGILIVLFLLNICCCCMYQTKLFKWFSDKLGSVATKMRNHTEREGNSDAEKESFELIIK